MSDIDLNFSSNSLTLLMWATWIILLSIFSILHILASKGIRDISKKNKLSNSYLAFIPGLRIYLITKLGYVIYCQKKKEWLSFITIIITFITYILYFLGNNLNELFLAISIVLNMIAYFNIYRNICKERSRIYIVIVGIYYLILSISTSSILINLNHELDRNGLGSLVYIIWLNFIFDWIGGFLIYLRPKRKKDSV